jgi:hypothetical protein
MAHHSQRPFQRLRLQVLERDQWTCQLPHCRLPTRQILRTPRWPMDPWSGSADMITPKSLGGSDRDINNLRAAHISCNSARGNGTHSTQQQRFTTSTPAVRGTRGVGGGGQHT